MEIVVYMANGQSHVFAAGPRCRASNARRHAAGRLFGSSSIILGSGPNCTFLKTASVSRIDVLTDEPLPIASTIRDSARVPKAMRSFRCVKWPPSRRWVTALPQDRRTRATFVSSDRRAFAAGRTRAGAFAQQAQFFTNLHRLF